MSPPKEAVADTPATAANEPKLNNKESTNFSRPLRRVTSFPTDGPQPPRRAPPPPPLPSKPSIANHLFAQPASTLREELDRQQQADALANPRRSMEHHEEVAAVLAVKAEMFPPHKEAERVAKAEAYFERNPHIARNPEKEERAKNAKQMAEAKGELERRRRDNGYYLQHPDYDPARRSATDNGVYPAHILGLQRSTDYYLRAAAERRRRLATEYAITQADHELLANDNPVVQADPEREYKPQHHRDVYGCYVDSYPKCDLERRLATDNTVVQADLELLTIENTAVRAGSERRRTDSSFLRPGIGHGAATVADSRLTVSVSGNELSQPTPKPRRSRFPALKKGTAPSRPSRIPTPVRETPPTRRYVSTPLLPSEQVKKENVPPKTHRLLRPISPSHQQSQIPKSRTLGMLGTLSNAFSRSGLSLHSNRSNPNLTRTGEPTVSISSSSHPPVPTFTTSIRQIHTAQENAYWSGRFRTLVSQLQQQVLEATIINPKILAKYIPKAWDERRARFINYVNRISKVTGRPEPEVDLYRQKQEWERKSQDAVEDLMEEEEEEQIVKVLRTLETLCVTTEAKRSFWSWQLTYARAHQNEKYLPVGGRMVARPGVPDVPDVPDVPEMPKMPESPETPEMFENGAWSSRVGRIFSRTDNGSTSSLPQQSEQGAIVIKKKRSLPNLFGLRERAGNQKYQRIDQPLE